MLVGEENIFVGSRYFLEVFSLDNDLVIDQISPADTPMKFQLNSVYPNPFNSSVMINFSLPSPSDITLSIFDLKGREVVNIVEGSLSSGYHQVAWHGVDQTGIPVSTGVYFIQLNSVYGKSSRKIHYLR